MGSCYCKCKLKQSELTAFDLKSLDPKTPAAIKLQKAFKSFKSRKLVKFIRKRKKNIADGIEIKQNWDCTNRLKIPEGFEYTQQNITFLRREIVNHYNSFFKYEIKSHKISIKEEDLLETTKENFLEKFKLVILSQMIKTFNLGSKFNDLISMTIDDSYQEKLLTMNYNEFSKVLSVSFDDIIKNKWSLIKGIKEESHSKLDESNCNINLENTTLTRTNTNIQSNKDSILNPGNLSLTSVVKNMFKTYLDREKENDKETPTGFVEFIKKKRVLFKSNNRNSISKDLTQSNSPPEVIDYLDKNTTDKKSIEENSPKYFLHNSNIARGNPNTKLWEDANMTSIEKILKEILSKTDEGDFITFLDNEEGTFYEGTIYGYYDKQGLGIELLFDKTKGVRYKYLGYFYKNLFHGYGIIAYENGLFYKGEFRMGQRTGYGIEISQTSIYRGFFLNNKYNGYGELKAGNEFYMGNFENGLKEGFGYIEYDENLSHKYIGRFRNNLMDGVGLLILPDNNYYYGEFKDNLMNGRGKFKWANGDIYVGGYHNNLKNGEGEYYIKVNNVIMKGSWENGEKIDKFRIYLIKDQSSK